MDKLNALIGLISSHGYTVTCENDVKESNHIELFCGSPLPNIGVNLYPDHMLSTPKRDNSFRDGSRGKGGKIKYARR